MINFFEQEHKYIHDNGTEYRSVSHFVDGFKTKVDFNTIAKKYAKKNGLTTEEVLTEWEHKKNYCASVGTLLHSDKEIDEINQKIKNYYNTECLVKPSIAKSEGKKSFPLESIENNMVYPELMIYNHEHKICGQSDKVIIVNDTINIWDYKSDEEIKFFSYVSKFVERLKFQPPLDHLDQVNGNIYSIKMSIYMYFLWRATNGKFKPGEIILEHCILKRDEKGLPILENGKPIILEERMIKLPYRKNEVIKMLEYDSKNFRS
jgi:hypothetical protein